MSRREHYLPHGTRNLNVSSLARRSAEIAEHPSSWKPLTSEADVTHVIGHWRPGYSIPISFGSPWK